MKKFVAIVLSVMLIATVVPFSFSVSAAEAPQKTGAPKARAFDVEATQEVTTEPVESTAYNSGYTAYYRGYSTHHSACDSASHSDQENHTREGKELHR